MTSLLLALLMQSAEASQITVYGALRPIMHEDKRAGIISLADAKVDTSTIGLGVAAELDGEITIVDGRVLVDRVRNGKVARDGDPGKARAALLALARVEKWHEFKVENDVSQDRLDTMIEGLIKSVQLDSDSRHPIKIVGKFSQLTAHVIDGMNIPRGESTHEVHMNSGLKIEDSSEEGIVVGFFSKKDAGVLTHHSSWTHLHIDCQGKEFAGHVDSIRVLKGSRIFVGV